MCNNILDGVESMLEIGAGFLPEDATAVVRNKLAAPHLLDGYVTSHVALEPVVSVHRDIHIHRDEFADGHRKYYMTGGQLPAFLAIYGQYLYGTD
jgi:hypothetical protein